MDKHCDSRFGFCPRCGEPNEHQGYVNVHKSHYIVCDKHKVAWPVGFGLFSSWTDETPEVWESNRALLNSCEKVEPAHCECADCLKQRAMVRRDNERWRQGITTGREADTWFQ